MGKILSGIKANLSDDEKKKYATQIKNTLNTLGEYKLIESKTIQKYSVDSKRARHLLLESKRKDGFNLIDESGNELTFEKIK